MSRSARERGYQRRYLLLNGHEKTEDRMEQADYVGAVEICPEHGSMPSGFLSPTKTGLQGNRVIDYSKFGSKKPLTLSAASVDTRDNRDPRSKQMQKEVKRALHEIRSGRNGHG